MGLPAEDVAVDELAPSAGDRPGRGRRAADAYGSRSAHAHAAKWCDACHAPAACEVDVILDHAAKATTSC